MDDLEAYHRLYLDIEWTDMTASDSENRERRPKWLEWTARNYDARVGHSASTPSGGEPGSALRNTGSANTIAARAPTNVASGRHTSMNVKMPTASAQQASMIMAPYAQSANSAKAPLRVIANATKSKSLASEARPLGG
jgi:hypothetical protein